MQTDEIGGDENIRERDLRTLLGIARGPGNFPTPSPERVDRLMASGLIKKKRHGMLSPTLKGRLVSWFYRKS